MPAFHKITQHDPYAKSDDVEEVEYEEVNHPSHYNTHPAGIECIDVIEHFPFNIATAMKYLWRAGLKPGIDADTDFQKAIWYIARESERLRSGKVSSTHRQNRGSPP